MRKYRNRMLCTFPLRINFVLNLPACERMRENEIQHSVAVPPCGVVRCCEGSLLHLALHHEENHMIDLDRYYRIGEAGCRAYDSQLAPVLWAALVERERLKELRRFARHLPGCPYGMGAGQVCSPECGLSALLSGGLDGR